MRDQTRSRSPWRPSILVLLGAVVFYFYLARPTNPIKDLEVVGNTAYLATASGGLLIVDVSNPFAPRQIGSLDTFGTAFALDVVDQTVYLADGRDGLRIIDVSDPRAPREVGAYNTPGKAEDIAVSGRYAYIADGRPGLLVVDIEKKTNPRKAGSYQDSKIRGNILRVAVQGEYAYLGDSKNQLRVVKIAKPKQPEQIGLLNLKDDIQNLTAQGGRVYVAASKRGMVVVDVTDPAKPTEVGTFDPTGVVQDVAVVGGIYAFVASGEAGLIVADISDLQAIDQIGSYSGVNNATQVFVENAHVYLGDEFAGLRILDAVVRMDIQQVSSDEADRGNAQDVAVGGSLAYLASGSQGLRVVNVSQPNAPRQVTLYDTPGEAVGVTLSGDFILLADGKAGLQILNLTEPDAKQPQVQEIANIPSFGETMASAVANQLIYLADGSAGLRVISIQDPTSPQQLGGEDTPGVASGVALLGEYAYVADGPEGLRVINIADPARPAEVSHLDTPGEAKAVAAVKYPGSPERIIIYLADRKGGMHAVDATDPWNLVDMGAYGADLFDVEDLAVQGNYAYLAAGSAGLRIISIANPAQLGEVGFNITPGEARGVAAAGQYAYLAAGDRGLRLINVSNPAAPVEAGYSDKPKVVRDVSLADDFIYLSNGDPGIRIESIAEPNNPVEVGHYDQAGLVNDVAVLSQLAYIADNKGLNIANVSDPKNPVFAGSVGTPGIATALTVAEDLAYVANGASGLQILNVSNPGAIQPVGVYNPIGPTTGFAEDVAVSDIYAFIADGAAGLQIANVADPVDPQTASWTDQFLYARSVLVIQDYVFLADETNGFWVIDVSKPVIPETIAHRSTEGIAWDLASSGVYLFVANRDKGVQVWYVLDPGNPLLVGNYDLPGETLDIDVKWIPPNENSIGRFYIYVAQGERGLKVLEARKVAEPVQAGFYETPGNAPWSQVIQGSRSDVPGVGSVKTARTMRWLLFDFLVLGVVGFLFWTAFFAQFVLPLNSLRERYLSFTRLWLYVIGGHGPAFRIEDGKIVQRQGEEKRRGPGVVLLDTASAAMLRSKTTFIRPIGPGVVFTERGQFLHAETIDLHVQVRPDEPLGPREKEDPFAPRQKGEEREAYQARQKRRLETSGLTRDGVEVVVRATAVFKLRAAPGQGGTQFGYDPEATRLAITREGIVPKELRHVPWYEIPAYLAVDVWREYLSKFTLTELFLVQVNGSGEQSWQNDQETGLEVIQRMLRARLTQPRLPILDAVGRPTGEQEDSREFHLLEEMGIEVLAASIGNLQFPPTVEAQLVQQWLSTWLQRAQMERDTIERRRGLSMHDGEATALLDFSDFVIGPFTEPLVDEFGELLPAGSRPNLRASLEKLLLGTQQLLIHDTQLRRLLENEEKQLAEILEWVRR